MSGRAIKGSEVGKSRSDQVFVALYATAGRIVFDSPTPAIGTAVTLPTSFDVSGNGLILCKNLGDQDERRHWARSSVLPWIRLVAVLWGDSDVAPEQHLTGRWPLIASWFAGMGFVSWTAKGREDAAKRVRC